MAKKPINQGKAWDSQIAELTKLVKGDTPTGLIAYKLGRSEVAVRSKAQELGISLKPINRSPYNRHK